MRGWCMVRKIKRPYRRYNIVIRSYEWRRYIARADNSLIAIDSVRKVNTNSVNSELETL